jgi:putative restriction endonuclease
MAGEISAFIAITDSDRFECLSSAGELDEVNFWQPSPRVAFSALRPGEPLLFKLHSPDNYVVGGGFFASWKRLPVSLAWDAFGIKNGARNLAEMRGRIAFYRRQVRSPHENYEIGCILLEQPFFFSREEWLPVPNGSSSIQRGKRYPLTEPPGFGAVVGY